MKDGFVTITVSRDMPSRKHPEIALNYTTNGDLQIIFSPIFLNKENIKLGVGSKVICGYDAENQRICVISAFKGATHTRIIGKRPGFIGAGQIILSCKHIPANFRKWEGKKTAAYTVDNDGAIIIELP